MFNAASKTSFTVAVVGLFAAIAAIVAVPDRVGFTALVWSAVTAAAVGLAIFWFAPRDPVVPVSPEVEAATVRKVDVTDVPTGSPWPLVGAAAVTLLGIGAALGTSIVVMGLIAAAVATFAWLAQVWREHPSWTPAMTERLNDRFVVPIGLPATIIVFAGIAVISISRVFLTVSAGAAPFIAAVIAFAALGVFQLLSTRENVGRSALAALVVGTSVLTVGIGIASALRGEREFHGAGHEAGGLELGADDLKFSADHLQMPAATEVHLEFHNEDAAPHNFSMYEDQGGAELFKGDIVDGGKSATYTFTTPAAGIYYFQCDVHPDMNGEVEVAATTSEEPPAHADETTTTVSS